MTITLVVVAKRCEQRENKCGKLFGGGKYFCPIFLVAAYQGVTSDVQSSNTTVPFSALLSLCPSCVSVWTQMNHRIRGPLRLSAQTFVTGEKGEHPCHFKEFLWRKETDLLNWQPTTWSAVWREKPMRSPTGWRLQKQSEPSDSAKFGACEMTLCSNLKG